MMGTRSGSIDPGILLYMLRTRRAGWRELEEALDHESGLVGVFGRAAGMRELEKAAGEGNTRAQLAIEMFVSRAAAGIAAVTVLARVTGFARTAVLAQAVGTSCLGDVYSTANLVPNIVFEVVAGGALASLVVPVLAGAADSGDTALARRTAGALLGWAVLVLSPLALLGALLARPLMQLLLGGGGNGGCVRAEEVALGARMLIVFMPQVVLYGVGIVLTGVLRGTRSTVLPLSVRRAEKPALYAPMLAFLGELARGGADGLVLGGGRGGPAGLGRCALEGGREAPGSWRVPGRDRRRLRRRAPRAPTAPRRRWRRPRLGSAARRPPPASLSRPCGGST